jgi:hypothetical protein
MNNDTLLNQARDLYTALYVEQFTQLIDNKKRVERLNQLVKRAYCRYQRRLNYCVLCYQYRTNDCGRESFWKEGLICSPDIRRSMKSK